MPSSFAALVSAINEALVFVRACLNEYRQRVLSNLAQAFRNIGLAARLLPKLEPTTIGSLNKIDAAALAHPLP